MLSVFLLLAIGLWFGLPRFRCGLDLGDEGALAYGAVRVLEGQIPNRDFVTIQPPLSFYTVAAVFKVFGTSLLTLHALGFFLAFITPLLAYGLARQFNGPGLAFAASVPAVFFGISFTHFVPLAPWHGMAAALAAAWLYLRATRTGLPSVAFFAGCLTSITLLLRQDQGVYLLLAMLIYNLLILFSRDRGSKPIQLKQVTSWWGAGFGFILVPFATYWVLKGAVSSMIRQLLVFALTTYPKTSASPIPRFSDLLNAASNAYILLYYLVPAVVLGSGLAFVLRARRSGLELSEAAFGFLTALSGLWYCQVLVRSDLPHLLLTLLPFFVLAASSLRRCLDRLPKTATALRRTVAALAVAAAVWFFWLVKPLFIQAPLPASLTLSVPRAGVRVPAVGNLESLVQTVQQLAPPNRSILCLPYQPMLYFLGERRNPTRWNCLWPGDQTPADHAGLMREATKDPPALVVIFDEGNLQTYAPSILDYVHRDYQLAIDARGVIRFYVPK